MQSIFAFIGWGLLVVFSPLWAGAFGFMALFDRGTSGVFSMVQVKLWAASLACVCLFFFLLFHAPFTITFS